MFCYNILTFHSRIYETFFNGFIEDPIKTVEYLIQNDAWEELWNQLVDQVLNMDHLYDQKVVTLGCCSLLQTPEIWSVVGPKFEVIMNISISLLNTGMTSENNKKAQESDLAQEVHKPQMLE